MIIDNMTAMKIIVDALISTMFKISTSPFVISVKRSVKFKNGTMDNKALDFISIMNAIMLGKNEMKVSGVKALWASLNVFAFDALEIHKPLIKHEYAMMTTRAKARLVIEGIKETSSYIVNMPFATTKEVTMSIKLSSPVMIDEIETLRNFPSMISLLLIGKVKSVSSVPRSFSPAVASVAGYVAETVMAMMMNKKA